MERKGTLKSMVYDSLLSDIINGVYKSDQILTEGALIARFGVSKAPVREALIELCKDNFLKSLPRFGYQIVVCSIEEIVEIIDFRADMEISNLKRAYRNLTLDSFADFDNFPELWKKTCESDEILCNYTRNRNFHLMLCSLSGNKYVYETLDHLLRISARFFAQYYSYALKNRSESEGKYHVLILDALKAGDINSSCSYLEQDINAVKDQLQHVISQY